MDELYKPTSFNPALVRVAEGEYLKRFVVCAANRYPDGLILTGIRHGCPIMNAQLRRMNPKPEGRPEQGFVDQWGNWMARDEALNVVKMTEQPLRYPIDKYDTLYSENLY